MAQAYPLMPKATAVWLVDNTALTFDQIADFCGLHPLEVQALADGDVNAGIMGTSPILSGELTAEEIARCEKNTTTRLKLLKTDLPKPRARSKGPRYTPVNKRQEKPNAVAFMLKTYPQLADVQIAKLIGTTKPTIEAIRNKTHALTSTIKPVDPVVIGLCTSDEMEKAIKRANRRVEREQGGAKAVPSSDSAGYGAGEDVVDAPALTDAAAHGADADDIAADDHAEEAGLRSAEG